jgi:hypothetical protein
MPWTCVFLQCWTMFLYAYCSVNLEAEKGCDGIGDGPIVRPRQQRAGVRKEHWATMAV